MIFFLRKFIEALLLPIGLTGVLVLTGVLLRRRWVSVAGVVALYMFSTSIVGNLILSPLERVYDPVTVAAAPSADAIVVLSGANVRGMTPPGLQWGDTSNRYFGGLDLALSGKAKLLVFTATGTEDPRGPNQGVLLRENAIQRGVQPDRIVITHRVLTTEDEAREVAQIPGVHSILLVTSATHMPRAALLFRHRGLSVTPFPTDERIWGENRVGYFSFVPTASGLHLSEQAMREYYGLAVYRLLFLFRSH